MLYGIVAFAIGFFLGVFLMALCNVASYGERR